MAIKRIVSTEFWTDDKVVELFSPEDKLFFLYLMTNPHTTQLGIYQISKRVMAFELGYSLEAVMVLIDRFEHKYGLIKYSADTSEIAVRNYLRHSIVKGGKPVEDLLIKEISEVKDPSLLDYVYESLKDSKDLNVSVSKILPFLKENANENVNDNDNDNDDSSPVRQRIVDESISAEYEKLKEAVLDQKPRAYKTCEWCGCKTTVLHKHHFPIPKRLGGTETVNICSNCHAEFHSKEAKVLGSVETAVTDSKRFKPPTLEEVSNYCTERNNDIDPERFIDFYESKGWMVGKNKMKDWKAAVRSWEKRDKKEDRLAFIDKIQW